MNIYTDKWGRFHHKPTDGIEPSSGNGWIFTAYVKKAGVPVDDTALYECSNKCFTNEVVPFGILRSPGQHTPPVSRDEILGLVSLGLLILKDWNFSPFPIPKFSAVKLAKQLWELRPSLISEPLFSPPSSVKYYSLPRIFNKLGLFYLSFKHRNYFWQNNLDQLYRFAFSVPVQDRYFILKTWDKFQWFNPAHLFYAAVAKLDKLGKPSGIRWLKYGGEKNKLAMVEEFPADHDIRTKLGL